MPAAGLMPTAGHLSTAKDVFLAPPAIEALAPLTVEALAAAASTPVIHAPLPLPVVAIQEVALAIVPATQDGIVVVSLPTIVEPLLSAGVAATGASTMMPPSSMTLMAFPSVILAMVASLSSLSCPRVLLGHSYTSSDVDSLWGATYTMEHKTPVGFVSAFDKNLIRSTRVQNATDSAKVFLQRSLAILEENGLRHQETVQKVASLAGGAP